MPDVRSIFIRVLLSLTVPLSAADLPSSPEPAEITAAPLLRERLEIHFDESISRYADRRRMLDICRSDKRVFGCTDFPDERLSCACELSDGQWLITANARIKADIHTKTGDVATLSHERRHIEDLRLSLKDHLTQVLSLDNPTEGLCRIRAKIMSSPSYLREVMNRLRRESNRKFGCS